jgi:glycosyltransferase involved in cell wall biosynthesis
LADAEVMELSPIEPTSDAMTITQRDDVIVVVPTYNEAENVRRVVDAARVQGVRVLVVDDASPDGTGAIADSMTDGYHVTVLHRANKEGLGPAYAAGFRRAIESYADIVCEMDADLSHDPADLPRLIAAIDGGADVALGSRYVRGGGVPIGPGTVGRSHAVATCTPRPCWVAASVT